MEFNSCHVDLGYVFTSRVYPDQLIRVYTVFYIVCEYMKIQFNCLQGFDTRFKIKMKINNFQFFMQNKLWAGTYALMELKGRAHALLHAQTIKYAFIYH